MRTPMRDPDDLHIVITRHPFRAETSLLIEHEEAGLKIVVYDGWLPVSERACSTLVERVVDLWVRTGPLAAAAFMLSAEKRAHRPRRAP